MTMLDHAVDTENANAIVSGGLAQAGDLVVWKQTGAVYKVTGRTPKKYKAYNIDGRDYLLPFRGCVATEPGTVFNGPEVSRRQVSDAKRREEALAFGPGDTVEFIQRPGRKPEPDGRYLITRATSPTRFKLQEIGGHREYTTPAALIRKVQ